MSYKRRAYFVVCYIGFPLVYIALVIASLCARRQVGTRPRLVWGEAPIINNVYWSRALRRGGYPSETYTDEYCHSINSRAEYDRVLQEHYRILPVFLRYYPAFVESLFRYDVFFISFNGYFLGKTPYWWIEGHLLRLARKKVVVIPFGLDGYIYNRVRSTGLLHGLLASLPLPARQQAAIAKKVDYWCANADFLIPGFMGPDGYGRWDLLIPSPQAIDEELWHPTIRRSDADGSTGRVVYVAHAPNHRGFKGSEFVVAAVKQLQSEGIAVELLLLEKVSNSEVRRVLREDADILVEQLICTAHGLNGIEGMASGLPVISNFEDEQYTLPIRRWSHFSECPIVSGSPETLTHVLRKLIQQPDLRCQLGIAGRAYIEKFHSTSAMVELYGNVIDFLYGRRGPMHQFCHPLLGEFRRSLPKVEHPLHNNRIPQ